VRKTSQSGGAVLEIAFPMIVVALRRSCAFIGELSVEN